MSNHKKVWLQKERVDEYVANKNVILSAGNSDAAINNKSIEHTAHVSNTDGASSSSHEDMLPRVSPLPIDTAETALESDVDSGADSSQDLLYSEGESFHTQCSPMGMSESRVRPMHVTPAAAAAAQNSSVDSNDGTISAVANADTGSQKAVRSRTILYFDSDDEDEDRDHVKETVVEAVTVDSEEDVTDSPGRLGLLGSALKRASEATYRYIHDFSRYTASSSELDRLLPRRKLSILACTWNMAEGKYLPENLYDLLLPSTKLPYLPDMFLIGTQESKSDRREWEVRLQHALGPSHVLVNTCAFGVLYLSIFIKRDLIWYLSPFENSFHQTRAGMQFKTKGGEATAFFFFGSSFLILNSHLSANLSPEGFNDRIRDFKNISRNINLPRNLPSRNGGNETTKEDISSPTTNGIRNSESNANLNGDNKVFDKFDYVIWLGDLNFRINMEYDDVRTHVKQMATAGSHRNAQASLEKLLGADQLRKCMNEGLAFSGFQESPVHFMPSYKYDLYSDKFDSSAKQRTPAFTDRIVYRSREKDGLACLLYDSCPSILTSDHKPVIALFEAKICPISDQLPIPPGGGSFNHDVYLSALKRKVATHDNAAISSVCVIL